MSIGLARGAAAQVADFLDMGASGDILEFPGERVIEVNRYRDTQAKAEAARDQGELVH